MAESGLLQKFRSLTPPKFTNDVCIELYNLIRSKKIPWAEVTECISAIFGCDDLQPTTLQTSFRRLKTERDNLKKNCTPSRPNGRARFEDFLKSLYMPPKSKLKSRHPNRSTVVQLHTLSKTEMNPLTLTVENLGKELNTIESERCRLVKDLNSALKNGRQKEEQLQRIKSNAGRISESLKVQASRTKFSRSLDMSTSNDESIASGMSRGKERLVSWPEVYCFGDSLTQRGYSEDGCWVSLLSNELIRRCDVINRGFSGYNTRWCRMILPRLLNQDRAKNIVCAAIFLGANDSVVKEINPTQHVPLAEYKENLIAIVNFFQSVGVEREKIILVAPPPCDEEKYGEYCKENDRRMCKSQTETKLYAETCCNVAEETGVECLNLFTLMTKVDDWPKFMNDGLHFSKEGSEFVFNTLWPAVDRRTKHLPFTFLDFKDIDYTNPKESLEN